MATGGIGKTDGPRIEQLRTEQRKAENTRAETQKQADQTNREVPDTRKVVENGRGENMDLTA